MNLELLQQRFEENFSVYGEVGASVSVWREGEELLTLAAGKTSRIEEEARDWHEDTLVPVWSATKGPAAVTTILALDRAGISPQDRVSEIWPELRAAQNSQLTFSQILSHQSGLSALSSHNRPSLMNRKEVIRALERQEPFWAPGTAHGYSPRMIGFLLDEIVRRVSASEESLGSFWKKEIADSLHLDFWIGGLPKEAWDRLATIHSPRKLTPSPEEAEFYRALGQRDPESHSVAAFTSPEGMKAHGEINRTEILQAGFPAFGGVGSARALAKFYQLLGNKEIPSLLFRDSLRSLLNRPVAHGADRTLLLPTRFSAAGFMMDPLADSGEKTRAIFGPSPTGFGQPGAGGSHAFYDPENHLSFAYVMNQMESGIFPNAKSLRLIEALYQ